MKTELEATKKFLAQYFHNGAWWGIEFYAVDFDDAEIICKKLNLQLEGEHVMSLPAGGSAWLPNLIIGVRNFLAIK